MGQELGVPVEFITTVFRENATIDLGYETYVLRSLLGSGGLGVVVKAQKRTGELVALKFLYNKDDEHSAESLERFKQEIKATKMVGDISDACVRVYECGQYAPVPTSPPIPFFAMEYVPGLSLEDFILLKETPFTPHEIYIIMRQLASALEEIHDKGIVHRDIKPSNVLFHENRRILKVTDFGISRDLVARTNVTMPMPDGRPMILGTLNYLSRYYFDTIPVEKHDVHESETGIVRTRSTGERISVDADGRHYCAYKGKKLDVSVLASTILFELTTCVNPHAGITFPAILTDIMSGNKLDLRAFFREHPERFHPLIHKRPAFLTHLDRIIRRGCMVNRSKTYPNARALMRDLDRAIEAAYGSVPGAVQADEIMATLLGKSLVDEYEHGLRRLERAIRGDRFSQERNNIPRVALLYKLKRTDRLMACIDLLHARTARLLEDLSSSRKECHFFLALWDRLERFGIEQPYRRNSAMLRAMLTVDANGGQKP